MSSSSNMSLKIVVAYCPGVRKKASSRQLSFGHVHFNSPGREINDRRSGFMRVAENSRTNSGVCPTMPRSNSARLPPALVPPSPHKGPVGTVSPASPGSPSISDNQLLSLIRQASTSLNNQERAAEKYIALFEASPAAGLFPLRPRPPERPRAPIAAGFIVAARSRLPPSIPNL